LPIYIRAPRIGVSSLRKRYRSSFHKHKIRQDLESLHGKGAAIAAILAEIQPVPCMDFQIREKINMDAVEDLTL
jgi:hypothetical protein